MNPTLKTLLLVILGAILMHNSCKKEYSCEGCIDGNKPPIAIAGPDNVITLPTDSVALDGSASSDPDGTISSFLWTKISGPASFTVSNASAATTTAKSLVPGAYQFELKVIDNDGLSAKDTMRVVVDSVLTTNHPPIANAGADQTIVLPANTVNLDGSASNDPDNNITVYLWTKIAGPSVFNISNANAIQPQITNLVQGAYQFELNVTDAGGLFSKDTMQVIVNPAASNNLPPVAIAGNDTTIQHSQTPCNPVPVNFTLNGSNSNDVDGTIVSYLWTGPGNISSPNTAVTQVSDLFPGIYAFVLKVTDNIGATDDDTVQVNIASNTRPFVNAELVPIGSLSQTRAGMAIASVSNKILFAGGYSGSYVTGFAKYSRVDIFDIATNSWTIAELSQARTGIATAVLNNRVYFAGGESSGEFSSRVDIYDAVTNTWTIAELSHVGAYMSGSAAGNKVLFAGGYGIASSAPPVDIYDASTNTWSTDSLRNRPTANIIGDAGIAATAIGNKVFFAGNASDWMGWDFGSITSTINIYDVSSNTWSNSDLSIPRGFMASIAVGNKNYWAGGVNDQSNNYTNLVEIRDITSGISTFSCLSRPNAFFTAVQKNNKIVFFTLGPNMPVDWPNAFWQKTFDIFDIPSNTWSIGVLPVSMGSTLIVSVNNTIYVAGGLVNGVLSNQVWKLDF